MKLTNHRGDSGMKNSPGISARQGNAPIKENNIPALSKFNPETLM